MNDDDDDLPRSAPVIDAAAYRGGIRAVDLGIDQIRGALTRDDQFVWLGLYEPGPTVLRHVLEQCGIPDLAVADALHAHQRPKFEVHEGVLFVVLRTAHVTPTASGLGFGETHVFAGRNYIVTVRHGSLQSHLDVRRRCESTPHLLARGPGYVLYALIDFVAEQYVAIVQRIETDVEALGGQILENPSHREATAGIHRVKRQALALRRAVSPFGEVCNGLMRLDLALIPADMRPYFRDVYEHVLGINETIDAQRELLTTALEAHLSLMAAAQNAQMRRVGAWAAMLAVPTMIAAIYGMNFTHMPELQWEYGYYLSVTMMVLSCSGLYVVFRRSRWL